VKSAVEASLNENTGNIHNSDIQAHIQNLFNSLSDGSTISKNIKKMAETNLLFMFRSVAASGLQRWAPDIHSGNPSSMYNLLHEHIALATFLQVSSAFGYSHLGNNLSFIHNFSLMRKLYRNFVYAYMCGISKSEAKEPGSVVKKQEMTNVWKRRKEVSVYDLYSDEELYLYTSPAKE
jgi:hypothetical protein